jgi:hypothetical protein
MPVAYPGGGPTITVEALLKQPRLIARRLTDLTSKRFAADAVFMKGTPDQVAGGAALFQRSEAIFPLGSVEEVLPRSEYPRTTWTEAVLTAAVHKYGLEFPVSDEQRRRNAMDTVARGQRKLANAIVKFVDTLAMNLILSDTAVQTGAASGDWTTPATDIIADIAKAKTAIANVEEGYSASIMVVNPAQELDLLTDKDIRDALPREGAAPKPSVVSGMSVPLLGLDEVRVSAQLTAGKVIVADAGTVGTIADEAPMPEENYSTYATGGNFAPIYTKVYRNENVDETIVRGARFPAMWIAEPQAAYILTAA